MSRTAKLIFVGAMDVGKSSIVQRFDNNQYPDTSPTIMCAFFSKTVTRNSQQIKMEIWDTAGQERFYAITPIYFRNANCCILVFDLTDRDSFMVIEKWKQICDSIDHDTPPTYFLVGNKSDKEFKTVCKDEIEDYCKSHGIKYYIETSAFTGDNVSTLQDSIIDDICGMKPSEIQNIILDDRDVNTSTSGYCRC